MAFPRFILTPYTCLEITYAKLLYLVASARKFRKNIIFALMKKKVFIGPYGRGKTPKNGASIKNCQLLNHFRNIGVQITPIDTEDWKLRPSVLLKLFFSLLTNANGTFILAADSPSVYKLLRFISYMPGNRHLIYWVIGGSVANRIKDGTYSADCYNKISWFLVEGNNMKQTLEECGFSGKVICVPNFKEINYIPNKIKPDSNITKFVFLSRIIPDKGCNLIIEATRQLNACYGDRFLVDFYGPIGQQYSQSFLKAVESTPNISYKGFLYLFKQDGLDTLASYSCMLFPTFWHGEGFPGILIDAFVTGLPVIASNWNMNEEILKDGETGIICKAMDVKSLRDAMERVILYPEQVQKMSENCTKLALRYNTENILTEDLLKRIGILD